MYIHIIYRISYSSRFLRSNIFMIMAAFMIYHYLIIFEVSSSVLRVATRTFISQICLIAVSWLTKILEELITTQSAMCNNSVSYNLLGDFQKNFLGYEGLGRSTQALQGNLLIAQLKCHHKHNRIIEAEQLLL